MAGMLAQSPPAPTSARAIRARTRPANHRGDAGQPALPLPVLRRPTGPADADQPRHRNAPDDLGRVSGRAARALAHLPRPRSLRASPLRLREHRGDLVAYLRYHYGTIGFQVWRRPPYPSSLAHSDMDGAWKAATSRQTGGPDAASRHRHVPARALAQTRTPRRDSRRRSRGCAAGVRAREHRWGAQTPTTAAHATCVPGPERPRTPHPGAPSANTKGAASAAPFATSDWTSNPSWMYCVPVGPIRRPAQGWPGVDSLVEPASRPSGRAPPGSRKNLS